MQSRFGDLWEWEVTQQACCRRGITCAEQNTRFDDLKAPFQPDHEISLFRLATPFSTSSSCWAVPTRVLARVLRVCAWPPRARRLLFSGQPLLGEHFAWAPGYMLALHHLRVPYNNPGEVGTVLISSFERETEAKRGKVTCQGRVTKDHRAGACVPVSLLQKSMFYT